jgi:hypothetical protein
MDKGLVVASLVKFVKLRVGLVVDMPINDLEGWIGQPAANDRVTSQGSC